MIYLLYLQLAHAFELICICLTAIHYFNAYICILISQLHDIPLIHVYIHVYILLY